MELRIDPTFPSAFERLRKGARKKAYQVRDALADAARNGQGLPQRDKLTLPWKQHKRTVFWVRIDRAIRLMYEQEGDMQTVLYVGKHQEAEAFLRHLPKRPAPEEAISLTEWLQRTAPPAAAARIDKPEKDRKPGSAAQRQLILALESLLEDCVLNLGPTVVEEYAAPQVVELERRFSDLKERLVAEARIAQQERERLEGCWRELHEQQGRLEQTAHAQQAVLDRLTEQAARLNDALAAAISDLQQATQADLERRHRTLQEELTALRRELTELREERQREASQWLRQFQSGEEQIAELAGVAGKLRGELRARLAETIAECRKFVETVAEQQHREAEEHHRNNVEQLKEAHTRSARDAAQIHQLRQSQEALAQRLAEVEQRLTESENRGLLERMRRLWTRKNGVEV